MLLIPARDSLDGSLPLVLPIDLSPTSSDQGPGQVYSWLRGTLSSMLLSSPTPGVFGDPDNPNPQQGLFFDFQNTVSIEFTGDGRFLGELPQVEEVIDFQQVQELRLKPGSDPQAILQAAVGRIEIRRFEVMTPTLHNIFVQQVGDAAEEAA